MTKSYGQPTIEWRFSRFSSALLGLGTSLTAVVLFWIAAILTQAVPLSSGYLLSLGISLPFGLALIVGGVRISAGAVPEQYHPHLVAGLVSGCTFFVVFLGTVSIGLLDNPFLQLKIICWAATIGSGSGFVLSYLHIRGLDREVGEERAVVRADEAERREALLEYLHGLLRHEVLNTATAIKGHADLATESTDDPVLEERIAVIQRQTDDLTRVIDDVRSLLQSAQHGAELRPVALTPILESELRDVRDNDEHVKTNLEVHADCAILADDLLRRLFSNLFDNAVRHNEQPTPAIDVTVTASAGTAVIEVEDNGPGFPSATSGDIFEPVPDVETNHGLGLAIVDRLAQRFGGTVELTQTGDDGSVITVSLPRANETTA